MGNKTVGSKPYVPFMTKLATNLCIKIDKKEKKVPRESWNTCCLNGIIVVSCRLMPPHAARCRPMLR
jgi:hypothetical protein